MSKSTNKTIFNAVAGRIRIRAPALQDAAYAHELGQRISQVEGVTKVSPSARAGSILVHYDSEEFCLEEVKARVAAVLDARKGRVLVPAARDRSHDRLLSSGLSPLINLSMLASLVAALAGSRKTRRASGKVFLALLVVHLFLNRNKFLRDVTGVLS